MDTRMRWIVGILLALVIGLAVGLVIVAGDNSEDETTVTVEQTDEEEPTEVTTEETETEPERTVVVPTDTTGGTKAP